MVVDRRDHVQYLTVSKSYSDYCKCSLTKQNTTLTKLYYGLIQSESENIINLSLASQVLMKYKARSTALASAVKIDESSGIRCI